MTRSSKRELTKPQTSAPRSLEEKEKAFRSAAKLIRELKNEQKGDTN
ncbi:MAG: hypothetical protein ACQEXG_07695 [Pseudomonadota bacterium]